MVTAEPGAIERVLKLLKAKLEGAKASGLRKMSDDVAPYAPVPHSGPSAPYQPPAPPPGPYPQAASPYPAPALAPRARPSQPPSLQPSPVPGPAVHLPRSRVQADATAAALAQARSLRDGSRAPLLVHVWWRLKLRCSVGTCRQHWQRRTAHFLSCSKQTRHAPPTCLLGVYLSAAASFLSRL